MSSPARSAREKRTRTRGDAWATRPASEYSNSPWPKYGWLVQHAMIGSDRIIYQAMESLKPAMLPGQQGRLLVNASITRIAKATAAFTHDGRAMPRRTVAHRLAAMRDKRIFVEWNAEARAKNSPVGLSWRLVPFDSILEDWKNDPNVATPKNRAFWFIGKSRHIMTPTEAAAWMLKADVAERNPAAHVGAIPLGEAAIDAAVAGAGETAPLDFEPLIDALIDVSGRGDAGDAQFIWTEVVKASGRHALPPVDAVARLVREMGATRRKIGQQAPLDHGGIKQKIGGYLEGWRRRQTKERAAQQKAEQWAREDRINRIAEWMLALQGAELPDDERAHYAEMLAIAEPAEVEAAARVLKQSQSRTA
jgi:hypothetical protein